MKSLLLVLYACLSFGATTHQREVKVGSAKYIVSYEVKGCDPAKGEWNCMVSVPATYPPGQPHYEATIMVFRISKHGKHEAIGISFSGTWTPNGCTEDDPEKLVDQALHQKPMTPATLPMQSEHILQLGTSDVSSGRCVKWNGEKYVFTECKP